MEQPVKSSNALAVERTQMAAERTALAASRSLMAWVRTGLSMIGFGFTIYKFLQGFDGLRPGAARRAGLFLVALGISSVALGSADYWQFTRGLRQRYALAVPRLPLAVAGLTALLGTVLFLAMLMHLA